MCLLCFDVCFVNKEYNVRRHFKTTHQTFDNEFPPASTARQTKVRALIQSYERSSTTLFRALNMRQSSMAASLRAAWILSKKKRPFTDSETVKECMLAAVEEVVADPKVKDQVITSIKSIPLSDTTTGRRVELLATEVFDTLLSRLKAAEVMSLAVDESTDNADVAQLCLYVRVFFFFLFFDGDRFTEGLLALIPLEGRTTGEIIFDKIVTFFKDNGLDLQRVNLLVTDGAPSMAGKSKGLRARLSAIAPKMQSLHCVIHRSVLCSQLSVNFKHTMECVTAIINLIRSTSSLQHRLFRQLLADMSADHTDLLLHNIRWLMCDVFHHLNCLNLSLQGRDRTVIDTVEKITAFQRKLDLFTLDLNGRLSHSQ